MALLYLFLAMFGLIILGTVLVASVIFYIWSVMIVIEWVSKLGQPKKKRSRK